MRCCRSDWPGRCLLWCSQPLCVVSQQSWFGLIFDLGLFLPKLSNFTFVFVFLSSGFCLVLALVARVCYCLFFVCLEFQIIRFVISTLTPIFLIFRNFLRFTPPPPFQVHCCYRPSRSQGSLRPQYHPTSRGRICSCRQLHSVSHPGRLTVVRAECVDHGSGHDGFHYGGTHNGCQRFQSDLGLGGWCDSLDRMSWFRCHLVACWRDESCAVPWSLRFHLDSGERLFQWFLFLRTLYSFLHFLVTIILKETEFHHWHHSLPSVTSTLHMAGTQCTSLSLPALGSGWWWTKTAGFSYHCYENSPHRTFEDPLLQTLGVSAGAHYRKNDTSPEQAL